MLWNSRRNNTPTSKIHQPSYPCDGHLPLSGTFTELKYKNSTWSTNKMLCCIAEAEALINIIQILIKKSKGVGVDTTCLCCFISFLLAFPALSTSADVSRPTVELSWLNNLVCPENNRFDHQSLWYFWVLGLPLQLPCPTFTPPMRQALKQAPMVEYLWACAAVTLWTQTSCCLLNVSWMAKHDSYEEVLNGTVQHFGEYAYSYSSPELAEKIDTTLMPVC